VSAEPNGSGGLRPALPVVVSGKVVAAVALAFRGGVVKARHEAERHGGNAPRPEAVATVGAGDDLTAAPT
jgi:hypothetical protein